MRAIPAARRLPLASLSLACWIVAGCGAGESPNADSVAAAAAADVSASDDAGLAETEGRRRRRIPSLPIAASAPVSASAPVAAGTPTITPTLAPSPATATAPAPATTTAPAPTAAPTAAPTPAPTRAPTAAPTAAPTPAPTPAPTTAPATAGADFSPQGYQLVFSDEFDGSSLDRTKWCTRYTYGGGPALQVPDAQCTRSDGGGTLDFLNDEQQRYRDVNSRGETMHVVSGGTLKLRATKTGPAGYAPYESAMIRSKLEFKPSATASYYITTRVKLPAALGTWPATWLAGGWGTNNTIQWPPEIDILEAPTNNVGQLANVIRQGSQVQGPQTATHKFEFTYKAADYDTQWQNYAPSRTLRNVWLEIGALWTAGSVCYFVDGVKTACENYNWVDNASGPANPAHLILNLAIGGAWAGASGIEDAKLPTQMEVDHVRLYRSSGG